MLGFSTVILATIAALPAIRAETIDVTVGQFGLTFSPPFINATAGDVVRFSFFPKKHSVTKSSLSAPCTPATDSTGFFDSDLIPVDMGAPPANWSLPINDTNPIWIYCKNPGGVPAGSPSHCSQGMVFAVNPGDKFLAFQAAATATGTNTTASAGTATTAVATTIESAYSTPAPPPFVTVTVTETVGANVWTTTYASWSGSPPPTPAAQPVNHDVVVGKDGGLTFTPPTVIASVNDTVTFTFVSKNHTATRSSFLNPCVPLAAGAVDGAPFDSGFQKIEPPANASKTFVYKVVDANPVFGFCRQTNATSHCGAGMTFAINPPTTGDYTFDKFQALAKRINGTTAGSNSTGGGSSASGGAQPTGGSGSKNGAAGMSAPGLALSLVAMVFGVAMF